MAQKNSKAEQKVTRIIRRNNRPMQAYEIAKAMNWQYGSDARSVITSMADNGQLVRTWDNEGNVFYSLKG